MDSNRNERIKQVLFQKSVVRDPGCPVSDVDDTALPEAFFSDRILHHDVIMMRIDTQMADHLLAMNYASMQYPTAAVSCDTVDRAIRAIIMPGALVYPGICRIFSKQKRKYTVDRCIIFNDIQVSSADILPKLFFFRMCISPLIRIAVFSHEFSGISIDLKDP